MTLGGLSILIISLVVFCWITKPVTAYKLALREWQETSSNERVEIVLCGLAVTIFLIVICYAGLQALSSTTA